MVVLPSTYFGNLSYFKLLLSEEDVVIEQHEHFVKQTYRNRCRISAANGPQNLIVPINRKQKKNPIHELEIMYAEKWQSEHWRAIISAYKSSPYFEYYEHLFQDLYSNYQPKTLLEWNEKCLEIVLQILHQEPKFGLTKSYDSNYDFDYRMSFKPSDKYQAEFKHSPYMQVFQERHGFVENLSILDLVFNEGQNAINILIP